MGTIRKSARERALASVDTHAATLARWSADQAAAEAELADLQARAGDEVLADESAAGRLPKAMQLLRDRADIAERAVAAVTPKLAGAKRAAVLAEVDEADQLVTKAAGRLAEHEARTAELLAALEAHEGRFISVQRASWYADDDRDRDSLLEGAPALKSGTLQVDLERAELRAFILREVAAGRDPEPALRAKSSVQDGTVAGLQISALYPASVWGPAALLPAPAYRRRVQGVESSIAKLDKDVAALPGQIEHLERSNLATPNRIPALANARDRLQEAPTKRQELAARLESLTGVDKA